MPEDTETAGGYAKELSEDFLKKEQQAIATRLPKVDVVITTAQVFGKPAPILITEEMVKLMKSRTVIVDLAGRRGGNCELTIPKEKIERHNVTIIGAWNLCAMVPIHASQMYSKNITNLFQHIYSTADAEPDWNDEIVQGACITHNVKSLMKW